MSRVTKRHKNLKGAGFVPDTWIIDFPDDRDAEEGSEISWENNYTSVKWSSLLPKSFRTWAVSFLTSLFASTALASSTLAATNNDGLASSIVNSPPNNATTNYSNNDSSPSTNNTYPLDPTNDNEFSQVINTNAGGYETNNLGFPSSWLSNNLVDSQLAFRADTTLLLYLNAFLFAMNLGHNNTSWYKYLYNYCLPPKTASDDLSMSLIYYLLFSFVSFFINPFILHRINPATFISIIALLSGVSQIIISFLSTRKQMLGMSAVKGVVDSGAMSATITLANSFYNEFEMFKRVFLLEAITFFTQAASPEILYWENKVGPKLNQSGWSWIFKIQGMLLGAYGIVSALTVPGAPGLLATIGQQGVIFLKHRSNHKGGPCAMDKLNKQSLILILSDIKIYLGMLIYFGYCNSLESILVCLPYVIKNLGYDQDSYIAGLLMFPPMVFGAFISCAVAWMIQRRGQYGVNLLLCNIIALGGWISFAPAKSLSWWVYFGTIPVVGGSLGGLAGSVMWLQVNLSGRLKRIFGICFQIGTGSLGYLLSRILFRSFYIPSFIGGKVCATISLFFSLFFTIIFLIYIIYENDKRNKGERDYRYCLPTEEKINLGDSYPTFRFTV